MANLTQMTIISTTMGKNPFEKNGIALLFNKRVWKEVLGCSLKNYRMISVHSKANCFNNKISSVQSSLSVMSNALRPHESQHARPPVHHQLLEFTQTHVHWVSDAIQPSHPLSSPSPDPNPSQHQSLFQWVNSWGGPSTGVSASVSFPPKKSQG